MNGIKFLMALAAVCILIMPAFSMPDNGMGQDGKQKTCDCQCDCLKLKIGQDGKQMWPGQDDKQMWQGKDDTQKTCGCPNSMMDQNDKQMWQGKDDTQKTCGCPNSMMDQDGKQMCQGHDGEHIKSMMGPDGDQMGHKHIKSMMGDRERGDNGGVKVVIVNVHV